MAGLLINLLLVNLVHVGARRRPPAPSGCASTG
jgi:hypothetical protein